VYVYENAGSAATGVSDASPSAPVCGQGAASAGNSSSPKLPQYLLRLPHGQQVTGLQVCESAAASASLPSSAHAAGGSGHCVVVLCTSVVMVAHINVVAHINARQGATSAGPNGQQGGKPELSALLLKAQQWKQAQALRQNQTQESGPPQPVPMLDENGKQTHGENPNMPAPVSRAWMLDVALGKEY
jgi:hypothetical protein